MTSNHRRPARFLWPTFAMVITGLLAAARVIVTPRFYFADDSQLGAFGQWWQLGDRLVHEGIPVLDPAAWQAGNYFAEGQWGLLNPLTWVIALSARWSENPTIHVTIVKLCFLMIASLGTYLLAREFRAREPWAALAAVLVPMVGFTVYMDAASWATGLFNSALLPWVWWGLRRLAEHGRSPLPYVFASYLLITFGYVFGVIALIVLLVETLVRAIILRDRGMILRTLAASMWGALLTVIIYLPGVLTAPVTVRSGTSIANDGFLSADLSDMAAVGSPTATGTVGAWWGSTTAAPLVYIAWLIPFFPLVLPLARTTVKRLTPVFVFGLAMLATVIGPSVVGPLRWPVRFMPYLALAVILLFVVAASEAFPSRVTRRGMRWSLVALVLMTGLSYANTPQEWRKMAVVGLAQAVVILLAYLVATRPTGWDGARRTFTAASGAIVVTAGVLIPQMAAFPRTPLPMSAVPDSVARMNDVLADAPRGGIVVGDVYNAAGDAASFDERLIANLWYLSPAEVSSLYTVLPDKAFSTDLCADLRGATCKQALTTLFSTDPTTGLTVADLMRLNTIVAMKVTFPNEPKVPAGWTVRDGGAYTWVLERTSPLSTAGGVTWSGDGTKVTQVSSTDTEVVLRVEAVGSDPRIALSRIYYPGYSVSGATIADPIRGWLLTVDVSDVRSGETIVVDFRPPGFMLMVTAGLLAGALLVAWLAIRLMARRRNARAVAEGSKA